MFAIALLGCAVWTQDTRWLTAAAIVVPVWVGLNILILVASPRARCAVCTGPLFSVSRNVKHTAARRFLGSYRLSTAVEVVLTLAYRCPHCGVKVGCYHRERDSGPAEQPRVFYHANIEGIRKLRR